MLTGPTEHAAPWPLARSIIRERAQAEWRAHPRFANDVSCWLPFRPVCVFSSSMQTPPPSWQVRSGFAHMFGTLKDVIALITMSSGSAIAARDGFRADVREEQEKAEVLAHSGTAGAPVFLLPCSE